MVLYFRNFDSLVCSELEIICVREFKQYLLAMNCRCRGVSTLLTNLLHQRQPMNRYDEPWQAQYADFMVGLSFGHISWIVYKECQVILFAIKTEVKNSKIHEILLNPSNDYLIKEGDTCVYISQSPKDINDIRYLAVRQLRDTRPMTAGFSDAKNTVSKTMVNNVHKNTAKPPPERYKLSRLPTPRHALLTGSRDLISRLGQSPIRPRPSAEKLDDSDKQSDDVSLPLSYVLEEPPKLEEAVIDSAKGMRGHILVCVHREVINIFKFIYNLRCMFPKVYYVVGDCRQPDDLLRAGVKNAKQVVVMSEKDCLDDCERNSDSPAIMTSHIIDLLVQERAEGAYTIVNLIEKSNIRFMHLLQEKDVAEEIDVFYTPAYAAGDVIADSLISNVLLSQTYYKPDIVSIIKTLCGMPGPLQDGSVAHLLSSSPEFDNINSAAIHAPHLTSMAMPEEFVDQTFAFMFETLLLEKGVMPLALLRAPNDALGNELPFVYTNPVPSLILKASDEVFILTSPMFPQ
ncbi:hypothetical protein BX666DRAFT_2019343 [Dichotomocladium elegans]|nr:hypothetical protein BX666DRAFT_2019343 [Dichotomocladium elegans]